MFHKYRRGLTRAFMLALALAFIPLLVASAVDNRPTGSTVVNTDGSTTLFPILQVARYQFPALFPGESIEVDSGNGTGSGHGQLSIMNQLPIQSGNGGPNDPIDIALSSSACSSGNAVTVTVSTFTEAAYTKNTTASALNCGNLTDVPIAKDAITILVNQAKATCIAGAARSNITRNMVQSIYMGLTYNGESTAPSGTAGTVPHTWNDFWPGCGAENIVPRSRIIGSGTRQSFFDLSGVTDANEQAEINATGLSRLTANADMEAAIAANPAQMAYTGLAFDNASTAQLAVNDPTMPAGQQGPTAPSETTVANNTYPWARVLHMYVRTGFTKTAIQHVIDFLYTSAMQGNIQKIGFVSIQRSTNPVVPAAQAPAPDWDVDANRSGNILDVTSIGAFFGQTGPASGDPNFPNIRGWVRADVNFDANVNILDITTFGPHFGGSW